jgi:hypothetical protein
MVWFPLFQVGEKLLEDYILVHIDNARDKFNMLM